MDCNVIKDLIPLYIDDCCCEESALLVKGHIASCPKCREFYDSMNTSSVTAPTFSSPAKATPIQLWKASILQSVLLFLSFAAIVAGVALEANTPSGLGNSLWALWLVVPATGFMLSLTNWYFLQHYRSKKSFSNNSCLLTLSITACAYIWVIFHYDFHMLFTIDATFKDYIEILIGWFGNGLLLTAVLCVLSKVFANKYASLLGKE